MIYRAALRKDTKADHVPPDLEDEIQALAPDVLARLKVREARLEATCNLVALVLGWR